MDDIFYMSAKKVGIIDISEIAKKVNVKSTFIPESLDVLEIESIFCISYHSSDFALIRPHIKTLLKEYGGWIGNDEYGFQPCFNLENLDLFNDVSI